MGGDAVSVIFRCPNCRAIVAETDEVCPICQHPVPAEARDRSLLPEVHATPVRHDRPRVGRMLVTAVAIAGWVVAIGVVALVLTSWGG